MKNIIYIITWCLLLTSISLSAQQREPIVIPLSNPGQNGVLTVNVHNGAISVTTHDKDEVELIMNDKGGKSRKSRNLSSLRRIEKQNVNVSISEDDNQVKITRSENSHMDMALKVPKNFSLFLNTHHNGNVYVNGTNGQIEVQSHHGGIKIEDVSGSVIANTHHGAIIVTMQAINSDAPMAFTTYHGDVDVSFPANLSGKLKMKSSKGDMYTDFEFEEMKPKVTTTNKGSKREIKLEGWTYGQLGNGGNELTFKTYHGDVIIRMN